jgi:DNA-binding IclR family transcriptional regulator
VAAAVLDGAGRPVAAVHIAGTLTKWDPVDYESRFSPFVVATARSLSSWTVIQSRSPGEGV